MNINNAQINQILELCDAHNVDFLYLFGSALTNHFSAKSDFDFLVKFKKINLENYFDNYISLKDNFEKILYKSVDLLEYQTLKNPYLISSIKKNKKLIYGRKNTEMAF